MKRILTFMLAFVLATSSLLGGCGGGGKKTAEKAAPAKPVNPFTLDYEQTDATLDYFIANDTVELAAIRQPLYSGRAALPGQKTDEFEKLRAQAIKQARKDAGALADACWDAQPALATMRSDFTVFLNDCLEKEPKLKPFATTALAKLSEGGTRELLGHASYESFGATATAGDPYAKSFMQFLEIQQAVDLGGRYLQDGNDIAVLAALLSEAAASSGNADLVDAAEAFDKTMTKDYKAAAKALDKVTAKMAAVDFGLRKIESADYFLSVEAMKWMTAEMEKLDATMDEIEARDDLTAQDVADINTWYEQVKTWNEALGEQLASLDTEKLVMVDEEQPDEPLVSFAVERAYAADDPFAAGYTPGQDYASATRVLAPGPGPKQSALGAAWGTFTKGVSSAFGKLKTGVGVTIDTLDAGTANIQRMGAGWYYGNSWKDICDDMRKNSDQIGKNYQAGTSGSSVIRTAGGYLDTVETGAGDAAGGAVEWGIQKTLGKGTVSSWTGWAVNGLVKTTAGMFTGLAKGIYKVADKQSSSADVATGLVEIGLSCIGGSKVIIKGSQVPGLLQGLGQGSKEGAKAVMNLIRSAGNAMDKKKLTKEMAELLANNKLTQAQIQKLVTNSIMVETKEALEAALAANRGAAMQKIRELLAAGKAASMTNFKETVKGSLEDLLQKSFKKSMQGWLDAGTTVIGANLKDYFDNLIGSKLDPYLTKVITDALAIPPDPVQMNGTWSGTMTVTKIEGADAQQNANAEGCEIPLQNLIGQALPLSITLSLSEGGSGSANVTVNGQTMAGQADYSGGSIDITVSGKKATYTFSGAAKFNESGMSMGGSFSASGIMSGTWSAAK